MALLYRFKLDYIYLPWIKYTRLLSQFIAISPYYDVVSCKEITMAAYIWAKERSYNWLQSPYAFN